jgi:hypothetical protein
LKEINVSFVSSRMGRSTPGIIPALYNFVKKWSGREQFRTGPKSCTPSVQTKSLWYPCRYECSRFSLGTQVRQFRHFESRTADLLRPGITMEEFEKTSRPPYSPPTSGCTTRRRRRPTGSSPTRCFRRSRATLRFSCKRSVALRAEHATQ